MKTEQEINEEMKSLDAKRMEIQREIDKINQEKESKSICVICGEHVSTNWQSDRYCFHWEIAQLFHGLEDLMATKDRDRYVWHRVGSQLYPVHLKCAERIDRALLDMMKLIRNKKDFTINVEEKK